MIINNADNVNATETSDEIVGQGPVYRKELMSAARTGGHGILLVTFEPGARLNFHIHNGEQILVVTGGTGIVATKEEERTVTTGDVIYIAPGENHWHGATADSRFSHIAIQRPGIRLAE
jgi:quercetin dioxygenase-like cupin family protein